MAHVMLRCACVGGMFVGEMGVEDSTKSCDSYERMGDLFSV